jgi:hypothetical protein
MIYSADNHPANDDPNEYTDNSCPAPTAGEARGAGPAGPQHRGRPDTVRVRVDVEAARAGLAATLADALGQGWALAREVDRLAGLLADERLRYANVWAAVRAAVHAAEDGETDVAGYLRIELPDLFTDPDGHAPRPGPAAGPAAGSAAGGVLPVWGRR